MTEFDELIKGAPEFWCMQHDQLAPYAYGMFALINVLKADNGRLRDAVDYLYGFAKTLGVDADDLREFGIEVDE